MSQTTPILQNKAAIVQLFIANTISGFAQGISMLAIPWYFTGILGQTSLFGFIYFGVTIISLFWGLFAGTLVDRYNRKHLFLLETAGGAMMLLGVAVFGFTTGTVPYYLVALIFGVTFWAYNLHYPALYAFVQEISDPAHYGKLASWLEIQGQLTSAIAGGIGALLLSGVTAGVYTFGGFSWHIPFHIEAWSIQKVFLLDGITYALSFLLILPLRYKPIAIRKTEKIGLAARMKIGADYLRANPLVFIFINASYFVFVTTMVINYILMPNFVKNYLDSGAAVYAIADAAFAIGALISGIFISRLFRGNNLVRGAIFMTFITAIAFFVLVFDRQVWVFCLMLLLFGLSNSGSRIIRVTYIFRRVPNQVIGRVQSIFQVINVLFRLFFIALFSLPFFVSHIEWSFGIFGFCCLLAAAIIIGIYPKLTRTNT